jgi:carboxyl-terminal processing protease
MGSLIAQRAGVVRDRCSVVDRSRIRSGSPIVAAFACALLRAPHAGAQSDVERVFTALSSRYVDSAYHPPTRSPSVDALLADLGDPNSRRLTATQFAAFQREVGGGAYVGVGLAELLGFDVDPSGNALVVITPDPESSAAQHGLRAHDRLEAIDGRPTAGVALATAADWLRGPAGSSVRLTVSRDTHRFDVVLERRLIPARGAMVAARLVSAAPRTGYLRIRGFTAATADSVSRALSAFARRGVRDVVVDLRDNPGGDLAAARRIAGMFVGPAPIALQAARGRADTLRAVGDAIAKWHVTVFVNAGTASAGELLAAALRTAGGATLLGEHTYGKGLVHSLLGPLSDGSVVIFTVGRLQTLAGADILNGGVEPDRHCAVPVQPIPVCR